MVPVMYFKKFFFKFSILNVSSVSPFLQKMFFVFFLILPYFFVNVFDVKFFFDINVHIPNKKFNFLFITAW